LDRSLGGRIFLARALARRGIRVLPIKNRICAVYMLPGYTHSIINLSGTKDLVTVMYCNEVFNPEKPNTYFDPVK